MATTPEQLATAFCTTYFGTFDQNRANLGPLYAPEATMTFEGAPINGRDAIVQKLTSLSFQQVVHDVTTLDCQMTQTGLLIFVVGQLKTDNDQVLGFSQCFHIVQAGESYFISNDIFRLALHHQ
ncbi:uncharacterized protein LOC135806903 [Sycon ciliatum]|uniref:uncharacterized protein LOC135806903 n=1 Tax=Sycon ciliatum TaxID=27933 RepID=UPI0031F6BF31